jgi:hypothetical protein
MNRKEAIIEIIKKYSSWYQIDLDDAADEIEKMLDIRDELFKFKEILMIDQSTLSQNNMNHKAAGVFRAICLLDDFIETFPAPPENKQEEIENSICISRNGIDEGNLGNRPYKTIDYAMQKFRLGMRGPDDL